MAGTQFVQLGVGFAGGNEWVKTDEAAATRNQTPSTAGLDGVEPPGDRMR